MEKDLVGYRFLPTEEDLINHYLKNKILGKHWLVDDAISEINICSYEPKFLPSLSNLESKEPVWYFFSRREFTSAKKTAAKRTTSSGFWKATGKDRKIKDKRGNGVEIGIKKTFVYQEGKVPNGVRTPWVMHEYHITCLPLHQRTYVICQVMYKGDDGDVLYGNNNFNVSEPSHSWVSDLNTVTARAINTAPEVEHPGQENVYGMYVDDLLNPMNEQEDPSPSDGFNPNTLFSDDNTKLQPQTHYNNEYWSGLLDYNRGNFEDVFSNPELIMQENLDELVEIMKCKENLGQLVIPSKDFQDFVGIEDHIAEVRLLLDLESEEARMVGIWGPSGIGKTTTARALFSRISRHFQGRIFIDKAFIVKCRKTYHRANPDDYNMKPDGYNMKLHFQKSIWSEILDRKDRNMDHLGAVREGLRDRKVLIFIDDLDDELVLDALAGQAQLFGSGSRIVLVTNDKRLLMAHGINHIYEVCLPSKELALEIFCRSAFRKNSPPKGLVELAYEFALRAGNLPLGLNVLGSYLRGRNKESWVDMLPRIRNDLDGKIEKTLKFSYDGLNNKNDEAIFCIIACFFNGEKVNDIKLLLANSDLDVNTGLSNLVDKSLIHVREGTVEMHPLLQEMGKEIVRTQSNEPGRRVYLVDAQNICDVLEDNTGTREVLGISLDIDNTDDGTKNLVQKKDVIWNLPERFDCFPSRLRLLSWDIYPMKRMPPPTFRPQILVKLQMQGSKLEKLWEGVHPLEGLKVMDLRRSSHLKEIPDLSMAINLQKLRLNNCSSLVELPSSIQYLNKLKKLDMPFCENLETLPTGINLRSLYRLDLRGCSRLRSFPNISTNISELHLDRTAIEEVPWWIERFTRLSCLHMNGCHGLQCVSLNLYELKRLETVDFSDCGALTEAIWDDSPNVVAMATDSVYSKLPVHAKASFPLPSDYVPKVKLNLINCFNLDQEALYQQQSVFFKSLELSGEEVPLYFTHRNTGTSLTIRLLQTSPAQQYFRFRACTVVDSESFLISHFSFNIHVCCQLTDRPGNHFDSSDRPLHFKKNMWGSHLVIFDCGFFINEDNAPLAEQNYYQVDIQFHLTSEYSQLKLKGCGIRLLKDSFPQGCEGDKRNEVRLGGHETIYSGECETDGILWNAKSEVYAKKVQSVRGVELLYGKSRRGDNFLGELNTDRTFKSQNSIENKRFDQEKEGNKHGLVGESSTMVTYNKLTSKHQVFINFWGEEVRFSFISHLVYALSRKGVNVFIEKYEKCGEDLGKAFQSIEDSNIALVIFSSRYTESRWCLDELVKIKERMNEGKLLIIPIFYNVEVSQVRQLEGDFGLKLWNLWRIHRDHRIIKWKDALETVAARTDGCLKEDSSESKFITLIVEKVMSRISLREGKNQAFLPYMARGKATRFSAGEGEKYESFLAKGHFFGLEQRMKKLEQKLEFDCNETRIIGVVGMADIGKTTLAKMLHEKWNCKFVRCLPFLDIRKMSEEYSPAWLRKTLLEVLLGGKFGVIDDKMTHESLKEKLLKT